ncbi:hypothetical protein ACFPYJ_19555 [Paenibacillus solisilvae]|uniref:Sporulation protein n=1 Tax=Paenibacillus solisilvae TaxID=2486751 RepID=A0ABW0W0P7_9BACL
MDDLKGRSALRGRIHERNTKQTYKKLSLAALALFAAISLSACGNKNSSNNMNSNSYGNDGYMGLSNSNPHLPNRNGQFLNYNDDGKFAEKQLKDHVQGIADASLMFQGPNLYVRIKTKPGYDEAQVRQKAISTLRYNMPRYTIHVINVR